VTRKASPSLTGAARLDELCSGSEMDAATLYTIVTLATGGHRTEAHGLSSFAFCNAAAKKRRERESLSSKTQIYCVKHAGVAEPRRAPRPRVATTAGDFPF
jgi:hypothetical protein